jgi:hypothetical protein
MLERQPTPPLFTQVEISPSSQSSASSATAELSGSEMTRLLRDILAAQDRQNELLEELLGHLTQGQKQRNHELAQWKSSNADLSRKCRRAAETLSRVQTEFLGSLTAEIDANGDVLADGEFMLAEFVDRFGPRLAHLNGVLQVLAQLGSANPTT